MGIQQIPAASSGGIKLVQRGQAVSAGNITITAVDTTKTFVRSFSEGASGTVATNSVAPNVQIGHPTNYYSVSQPHPPSYRYGSSGNPNGTPSGHIVDQSSSYYSWGAIPSYSISGGTMDATTKQFGVYLASSTTLTATGACRYEVVEFA